MSDGEIILYQSGDGARVQLRASGGTVWLTQAQIAELYDSSLQNVQQIIARVLADGEVSEATINSELIVRTEGTRPVRREVKVYNLDMVLAVGYRSTSPRAVQFRQWATSVLREYLVKGFAMDDAKLKAADGWDYFDEWLERIRSIRATTPDMGLTTWAGTVVRKGDVVTAKNYLASAEISELDRIVTMYLDYAEDQAERRTAMTMADWANKLDAFLAFNDRELLTHAGTVRAEVARALAENRYADFDAARQHQAALEADMADLAALRELEAKTEGSQHE
ncbi:RhuM family protein [Nocardia sp. FBN12]|uniref:RhuM family protein n=1 Tax=Nocardia sp. FBN12 TaxID=3419766 RepID=UPI003CFDCE69